MTVRLTEDDIRSVWGVQSQPCGPTFTMDVAMVNACCAAAVLAERQACAKLCEELEMKWWREYKGPGPNRASLHHEGMSDGAGQCAEAILKRSEQ